MQEEPLIYVFVEAQLTSALLVIKEINHCLVYASLGPHKRVLLSVARNDFANLSKRSKSKYLLQQGDAKMDPSLAKIQRKYQEILEGALQIEIPHEYLFGTSFEHKVWNELVKVRAGKTITYSAIAKNLGSPNACRAVGSAVGKNKLAILVPCHRCMPSNGSIGNFRWGSNLKEQLSIREKKLAE